ncbi:hypothetical protein C1H76_7687 [Elsinoe australis]|uniref:Uncharacterized protein n=1 Tax=Elsinoe australis TaxID=40998 RepID=A0A4U7AUT1_9PEZI|nr:hypothetical protein C1H76_7687 [Elsinoe australis]
MAKQMSKQGLDPARDSMDRLPHEIIAIIAEHLHSQPDALSTWMQCGRIYYESSIPVFYRRIESFDQYSPRDIKSTKVAWQKLVKLVDVFLQKPGLASFVEHFELHNLESIPGNMKDRNKWIDECGVLSRTLSTEVHQLLFQNSAHQIIRTDTMENRQDSLGNPGIGDKQEAWHTSFLPRLQRLEVLRISIGLELWLDWERNYEPGTYKFLRMHGEDGSKTQQSASAPSGWQCTTLPNLRNLTLNEVTIGGTVPPSTIFPALTRIELRRCRLTRRFRELQALLQIRAPLRTLVIELNGIWAGERPNAPHSHVYPEDGNEHLLRAVHEREDTLEQLALIVRSIYDAPHFDPCTRSFSDFHSLRRLHLSFALIGSWDAKFFPPSLQELRILDMDCSELPMVQTLIEAQHSELPQLKRIIVELATFGPELDDFATWMNTTLPTDVELVIWMHHAVNHTSMSRCEELTTIIGQNGTVRRVATEMDLSDSVIAYYLVGAWPEFSEEKWNRPGMYDM